MIAALIFLATYVGVALGRYPRLALDRTGIALLGALAMVLVGAVTPVEALQAVHFPTLILLYGLMIISAQLRLGGFYSRLALNVTRWIDRPGVFLLMLMLVSGLLAAFLANDIICLAFTPVLAVAIRRRRLNPMPFLLGLAMATNLGSAATLIGNPQSMLIGQLGNLSFREFLFWCAPPSLICLFLTCGLLRWLYRGNLEHPGQAADPYEPAWPVFNRWQSAKGLTATALVIGLLLAGCPREITVLTVAGMLLLSRRMHSRTMLALVDWHLITLFCGLFIVVQGLNQTGLPAQFLSALSTRGWHFENPYALSVTAVLLSNVVSNVPATVLITPHLPAGNASLWYAFSLATTYAGNLLTIGSMANLIVIEQARCYGITIGFRAYARTGLVVTAANLAVLFAWIWLRQMI